jgi:hypothetical protein
MLTRRHAQRPMHFFGRFGPASFGPAVLAFAALLYYPGEEDPHQWWIRARRASERIPSGTGHALAGASGS